MRVYYYRAYDIDYPNQIDWTRYSYMQDHNLLPMRHGKIPEIGGEIQIHGMGIGSNWTWGCIALRNEDMDELFSHREIGVGTRVIITGNEIGEVDVEAITGVDESGKIKAIQHLLREKGHNPGPIDGILGPRTRHALCSFQDSVDLPITCETDTRTLNHLRK